jgi:hypothetical protein
MNDEMERMWKKVTVAYFEVLCKYSEETKKNHEKPPNLGALAYEEGVLSTTLHVLNFQTLSYRHV